MTTDVETIVLTKLADHCPDLNCSNENLVTISFGDLALDSLAILEIVYDLEEHFDISIANAELQGLQSVGDMVSAIDNTLKQAA